MVNLQDEMSEAWHRDMAEQRRIDTLRQAIDVFLGETPAGSGRLRHGTHVALQEARDALKAQSDHIVECWN